MKNALLYAVKHDRLDLVKKALRQGGDINTRFRQGKSLLHIVSGKDNKDILFYLLDKKRMDPDIRDDGQNTPLHLAIAHSDFVKANKLIEEGTDLNAANSMGCTPLHKVRSAASLQKAGC